MVDDHRNVVTPPFAAGTEGVPSAERADGTLERATEKRVLFE